jgi:hypothetical protein
LPFFLPHGALSLCFFAMEGQISKTVGELADVWLILAQKGKLELVATLKGVNVGTLKLLLRELPVKRLKQLKALEAGEKAEKDKEKKESREIAKADKAKLKRKADHETKKQAYDDGLGFAMFYAKITQSMLSARDNQELEMRLFRSDSGTLVDAIRDAQNVDAGVPDADILGVKRFIQQALVAQKGLNSFAFVQAITIGKRFSAVFHHHQEQKDSPRFVLRNWTNYVQYLNFIAPGFDARQERNYRRTYEISEVFPCIRLISGCSINEFWIHMRIDPRRPRGDAMEMCAGARDTREGDAVSQTSAVYDFG